LEPLQIVDTTLLANKFLHHSFDLSACRLLVTTTLAAATMQLQRYELFSEFITVYHKFTHYLIEKTSSW